jgi:hypothetical protein
MIALMGTPAGCSQSESMEGHCAAGAVKRALGCAAITPFCFAMAGVHSRPCQSSRRGGGFSVIPSHQTPPSGVRAVLVKIVFRASAAMALGLVRREVPGATPK